jgi:hypothetical protein
MLNMPRVCVATFTVLTFVRAARAEEFVWSCRSHLIGRLNVPAGFVLDVYDYREGVVTTLHYPNQAFIILQAGGMHRVPLFQDPEYKLISSTEQESKTIRVGSFVASKFWWREDNFKPPKYPSKASSILTLFPPNVGYSRVPGALRAEFDRALNSFVREGEPAIIMADARLIRIPFRRLTLAGFPYLFNVSEIAQPSRRELRGYQILFGDEKSYQPALDVDNTFHAPVPRDVEIYSVDPWHNIYREGFTSESEELKRVRQIVCAYTFYRRAESRQSRVNRLGVIPVGSYEQIDVFGCARLGVKRNRISANDQVLNAVSVERRQEVLEVFVHRQPSLSTRKRRW